jgi:hypothetical protein
MQPEAKEPARRGFATRRQANLEKVTSTTTLRNLTKSIFGRPLHVFDRLNSLPANPRATGLMLVCNVVVPSRGADQDLIDPVRNLQNWLVYLWSGRSDSIVQPTVTNELRSFYRDFGANVFHYDNQFPAGHGWESPYGPVPCNRTSAPFINRCYDSPHDGAAYDSEEV